MSEGLSFPEEGRRRVAIENVTPQIDAGRFPIKRAAREHVLVEADIYADGPDTVAAVVKYRAEPSEGWLETPMLPLGNDRWRGDFVVTEPGQWLYTVEAWIDRFGTWREGLRRKLASGGEALPEIRAGAGLIEEAARRAGALDAERLESWAKELATEESATGNSLVERALDEQLGRLASGCSERRFAAKLDRSLRVVADPGRAVFSAWYEMFPRSCAATPGVHGTFKDCEAQLPRIAEMGFDVLYFPPIHPIGRSHRKGKNKNAVCQPGDPGSPWAVGASEGGHKAVHPELGTLEDFRRLVARAHEIGIETALDVALHCSPDHPYVTEHPEWFRLRPDGTINQAENPPKIYEDIYPFDFECDDWQGLWRELKSIFDFWIAQGVRVFRVDNPHTKPFAFWEWCIGSLKKENPGLILLSEAFARSKVAHRLAKLGFTQSYTYFPWRNSREELTEYLGELTRSPLSEYLHANHWTNTHDILSEYLQTGGPPGFKIRFLLAATLGASYGVYGPALELCESNAAGPGTEEYLNAEQFELRHWDVDAPGSLRGLISVVNRIRRESPALQSDRRLRFHPTSNDRLLAYSKSAEDGTEAILIVVNLDPKRTHSGWVEWPVDEFSRRARTHYQMHDLLADARTLWRGGRNYVELNPERLPAHIFRFVERVSMENDFDHPPGRATGPARKAAR